MKALILNSGMGTRMGEITSVHPKCMTEINEKETILSRQLKQLVEYGIDEVVMTTGYFDDILIRYCMSLGLPIKFEFIKNDKYSETNYIYSIYCARDYLNDDIILLHGDLVFDNQVLGMVLDSEKSCMTVSSTQAIPAKDFKAVVDNGLIKKIGIEFFNNVLAAQPMYKLNSDDWKIWLDAIISFCENDNVKCYAENAFNEVSDKCCIVPVDVKNLLCSEIDCVEDLNVVSEKVRELENRTVYMCFSTDIIHSGHIAIIKKAKRLGKLIIGVLTDEAVISYKRFPLLPFSERKSMFENINGVYRVVRQNTLSYKENILKYHPDFVVHGDDWCTGFQKPIRDEVVDTLVQYGGTLIEYPYSKDDKFNDLEKMARSELSIPDMRRKRLKSALNMKGTITAMEAHSGLTGLIVENTVVHSNGESRQFDAMWISSLCDSTAKGKPDIELVDMTSRFRTIDDIMEVTTKPIIFDGDTGGLTEHFVYTVRTLERMGVSMVIIEDKTGLKKNSLFGT
ncbi:MAG: isocitrate lyase/phosphoenolpyruvate mutase family protein, partial [Huintestinicola sp.]